MSDSQSFSHSSSSVFTSSSRFAREDTSCPFGDGTALQPNHKDADIGGRNTGNAGSLADGCGANFDELLTGFKAKTRHGGKIKCVRNHLVFQVFKFFNLDFLTVNVSGIFDCNFNLLDDFVRQTFISDLANLCKTFQDDSIISPKYLDHNDVMLYSMSVHLR